MRVMAKRTQIYLPTDLHRQAAAFAKGQGRSLAQVIRLSLVDFLKKRTHRLSKQAYEKDPIWQLVGAIRSKEGDLSRCHDYYLYGRPKASCRS